MYISSFFLGVGLVQHPSPNPLMNTRTPTHEDDYEKTKNKNKNKTTTTTTTTYLASYFPNSQQTINQTKKVRSNKQLLDRDQNENEGRENKNAYLAHTNMLTRRKARLLGLVVEEDGAHKSELVLPQPGTDDAEEKTKKEVHKSSAGDGDAEGEEEGKGGGGGGTPSAARHIGSLAGGQERAGSTSRGGVQSAPVKKKIRLATSGSPATAASSAPGTEEAEEEEDREVKSRRRNPRRQRQMPARWTSVAPAPARTGPPGRRGGAAVGCGRSSDASRSDMPFGSSFRGQIHRTQRVVVQNCLARLETDSRCGPMLASHPPPKASSGLLPPAVPTGPRSIIGMTPLRAALRLTLKDITTCTLVPVHRGRPPKAHLEEEGTAAPALLHRPNPWADADHQDDRDGDKEAEAEEAEEGGAAYKPIVPLPSPSPETVPQYGKAGSSQPLPMKGKVAAPRPPRGPGTTLLQQVRAGQQRHNDVRARLCYQVLFRRHQMMQLNRLHDILRAGDRLGKEATALQQTCIEDLKPTGSAAASVAGGGRRSESDASSSPEGTVRRLLQVLDALDEHIRQHLAAVYLQSSSLQQHSTASNTSFARASRTLPPVGELTAAAAAHVTIVKEEGVVKQEAQREEVKVGSSSRALQGTTTPSVAVAADRGAGETATATAVMAALLTGEHDSHRKVESAMNMAVAVDAAIAVAAERVPPFQRLMPHQKLGVRWLLHLNHAEKCNGILADEMGLGKTAQTVVYLSCYKMLWEDVLPEATHRLQRQRRVVRKAQALARYMGFRFPGAGSRRNGPPPAGAAPQGGTVLTLPAWWPGGLVGSSSSSSSSSSSAFPLPGMSPLTTHLMAVLQELRDPLALDAWVKDREGDAPADAAVVEADEMDDWMALGEGAGAGGAADIKEEPRRERRGRKRKKVEVPSPPPGAKAEETNTSSTTCKAMTIAATLDDTTTIGASVRAEEAVGQKRSRPETEEKENHSAIETPSDPTPPPPPPPATATIAAIAERRARPKRFSLLRDNPQLLQRLARGTGGVSDLEAAAAAAAATAGVPCASHTAASTPEPTHRSTGAAEGSRGAVATPPAPSTSTIAPHHGGGGGLMVINERRGRGRPRKVFLGGSRAAPTAAEPCSEKEFWRQVLHFNAQEDQRDVDRLQQEQSEGAEPAPLHERDLMRPILIVAPLSTLPQWRAEFASFGPAGFFSVHVLNGPREERQEEMAHFLLEIETLQRRCGYCCGGGAAGERDTLQGQEALEADGSSEGDGSASEAGEGRRRRPRTPSNASSAVGGGVQRGAILRSAAARRRAEAAAAETEARRAAEIAEGLPPRRAASGRSSAGPKRNAAGAPAGGGCAAEQASRTPPTPVLIIPHDLLTRKVENFLRYIPHVCYEALVIDEAHRIKNSDAVLFQRLCAVRSHYQLVLTGTPLQNNVLELFSLMRFLMPHLRRDAQVAARMGELHQGITELNGHIKASSTTTGGPAMEEAEEERHSEEEEEERNDGLQPHTATRSATGPLKTERTDDPPSPGALARTKRSTSPAGFTSSDGLQELYRQICRRIHQLLSPFLLRRDQRVIAGLLPPKQDHPVLCPLLPYQQHQLAVLEEEARCGTLRGKADVHRRKILLHPYTRLPHFYVGEELVLRSGKMLVLDAMMRFLQRAGHKFLIFCNWTLVLDVVETLCVWRGMPYVRLDGRTTSADREKRIRLFNSREKGSTSTCGRGRGRGGKGEPSTGSEACRIPNDTGPPPCCFLISKTAGGVGLNLQSADTVIILDVDYNPQRDRQALSRVYRVGQRREVRIFRLFVDHPAEHRQLEIHHGKEKLDRAIIQAGLYDMQSSAKEREKELNRLSELEERHRLQKQALHQPTAGAIRIPIPTTSTSADDAPAPLSSSMSPTSAMSPTPASTSAAGSPFADMPPLVWGETKEAPPTSDGAEQKPSRPAPAARRTGRLVSAATTTTPPVLGKRIRRPTVPFSFSDSSGESESESESDREEEEDRGETAVSRRRRNANDLRPPPAGEVEEQTPEELERDKQVALNALWEMRNYLKQILVRRLPKTEEEAEDGDEEHVAVLRETTATKTRRGSGAHAGQATRHSQLHTQELEEARPLQHQQEERRVREDIVFDEVFAEMMRERTSTQQQQQQQQEEQQQTA
eukprot:gene9827-6900_t